MKKKPFADQLKDLVWERDRARDDANQYVRASGGHLPEAQEARTKAATLTKQIDNMAIDAILIAPPEERGNILDTVLKLRTQAQIILAGV